MTGIWLVSYIFLWIIVTIFSLLIIGLLQQLGLLQRRLDDLTSAHVHDTTEIAGEAGPRAAPLPISEDGPAIGSPIPEPAVTAAAHMDVLSPADWYDEHGTIVLFMTPTCETCQHLVEPLNRLVDNRAFKGRVIVILRADETAGRAFLNLFPIHAPVVRDRDHTITKSFDVHRSPSGLLYDAQGKLVRKGKLPTYEAFLALLGDSTVSPEALASIYPPLEVSYLSSETGSPADSKHYGGNVA